MNLTVKKYLSKTLNVPFYEKSSGFYKVKVKISRNSLAGGNQTGNSIQSAGAREFITSYLPEFYSYLFDQEYFENVVGGDLDLANQIKQDIKTSVLLETSYETTPKSEYKIAILKTVYDFDLKRKELLEDQKMPEFAPNLTFFNEQQNIEGELAETTLTVGTLGEQNNLLNNGLRMFDTQFGGFEGQINLNADFGPLQGQATKILNGLVAVLSVQTSTQRPNYEFAEADTITLIFGKKDGKLSISGMEYLLIENSIQSQAMKVGYFSIVKNNKLLSDPLTLAVLRNYQNLLITFQDTIDTQNPNSFFDFLNSADVKDSLGIEGNILENFEVQPKKDMKNELLKVANEYGLIEINNVDELEKGFKDYFTSDEYQKLKRQVVENPEIFNRVAAAQSVKALSTAADVASTIANVIDSGPMGLINKANPQVAYIMRQFGIDDIAKEAFLCLTFGASASASRISRAAASALTKAASSVYTPPQAPKRAPISLPSLEFEQFEPFTISGDLWKQIEKLLVDTVQQIALEVIKQLADLLKENCAKVSPRSTDYGSNDITSFIENNPNPQNSLLPTVGAGSQLDQLSKKNGLTSQQILDYLSSLSSIVSSIDICILMMNREDAPDELLERILEFNQQYEDEVVRRRLSSISDILGFFKDLSAIADVTTLCNQIANELYELNQENVCLDEGIFDDENIQDLLELIEDGLVIQPPNLNLDCPDSEFLDPTIKKSIPETFNILAETVQLQFIASGDSIKEIFLEPVQKNQSRILDDIQFVNTGSIGEPINTEILSKIVTVLQNVQNGFGDLNQQLQQCDVDLARLLGTEGSAYDQVLSAASQGLTTAIADPNFKDAIGDIINKVENLSNADFADNPVFTAYDFNQNFLNAFRDYIIPDSFSYDSELLATTTDKFYSSFVLTGSVTEYRDLELLFKFDNPITVTTTPSQSLVEDAPIPDEESPFSLGLAGFAENEHYHLPTQEGESVVTHINNLPALGYQVYGVVHDITNGIYTSGHTHPQLPYHGPAVLEIPESSESPFSTVFDEIPTSQEQASAGVALGFGFGTEDIGRIPNSLSLTYPAHPEGLGSYSQLKVDFNLDRFFQNNVEDEILSGEKFPTNLEKSLALLSPGSGTLDNVNIFAKKFGGAVIEAIDADNLEGELEVYYSDFPRVYGQLVENAFEYILDNGIFDAATLQSLNFFTQTDNCPPDELGDFLDIQGIINQMIEEYKESACSGDDIPLSSKVRNVIKYGMYLLMVQIHIAETIIKNIFVMSAYNLDSLLDRESFVFTFIKGQILQSLLGYLDRIEPSAENRIRMDLTSYFNLKSQRAVTIQNGGILYLDGSLAIPAETQFSITDEDTFFGFDEILDFLIRDRIDRSRQAINNALRKALPDTNQMSFNESMLRTLPGLTVSNDNKTVIQNTLELFSPSSLKILNIPEVGLMMTMKIQGYDAANSAASGYANLTSGERQSAGLLPLEVTDEDFPQGSIPSAVLTESQLRHTTNHVRTNTDSNRIFVHISLYPEDNNEFEALNYARTIIQSDYPNASLTEAEPVFIIGYEGTANSPSTERYAWQVKGTLDTTQQANSDTLEDNATTPTGRRTFKLWFKKGPKVHLLMNLGYRNEGFPPISSDTNQASGGIPVGGLPTIPS